MRISANTYLSQVNKGSTARARFRRLQRALSLVVILCVFWGLKLTGITMAGEAFCGKKEHVHGDDCILQELICELEEKPSHVHSEECMHRILQCTLAEQEGHTHGEDCVSSVLSCTLEELEGHTHTEDCFAQTLLCTLPEEEAHLHDVQCYQESLVCTLEETEEHQHDELCVTDNLICSLPETEGHAHSDLCYLREQICTLEELEGHSHTEHCYTAESGYSCGLEEAQAHFHTDDCYYVEEGSYLCGLEETEGHAHDESCFRTLDSCPLEEHIHTVNCYSDISADLETSDDWEASLTGITGAPGTENYLTLTARSQLGYAESTLNFQIDEHHIRRGITRYGQWYGNPHGDWSTMFTCFCLHYAQVPEVPYNAGADALLREWEEAGLYVPATVSFPCPGNIVFLDKNGNGSADATAIITSVDDHMIVVIEGDLPENEVVVPDVLRAIAAEETAETEEVPAEETEPDEMQQPAQEDAGSEEADPSAEEPAHLVAETAYRLSDTRILGYGLTPLRSPVLMMAAAPNAAAADSGQVIAKTIGYSTSIFNDTSRQFVVYTQSGGNYYAFDGNGNAVRIYIDAGGNITSDIDDPSLLLWTFASQGNNAYLIRNVSTGRYMHAHRDGVTTSGAYNSTLITSGSGAKIRSNTEYAQLNTSSGSFTMTTSQSSAATYQFGYTSNVTVWLDGTNGGLMGLGDSPNTGYTMAKGTTFTLPEQWQSPGKYNYTLRGWYDVVNSKYYPPGAEVVVTDHMVFYADWVAASYDIGQFNSQVANTVSTNEFVTVRMFDYGALFNVQSTSPSVTVSASGHSETWSLITNGDNPYNGQLTLDFIFRDWDANRDLTYPNNTNSHNTYDSSVDVHQGLHNDQLENLLFATDNSFDPETGTGVIGKQYLGTADHLFQLMTDPNDPNYGYYYYNSEWNAASYNQSDQRFYVYEYLERTTDSAGASDSGKYSDFLPLNSPYVNTNGRKPGTYTHNGSSGEYVGTTHYQYEAKDANESPVGTNYLFGMSIDVDFYLPNAPGTGGNKDLYGKDMHFKFSGDDDVWVVVDDTLVLDLGGIHGIESGDINFSTGVVTINGERDDNLSTALSGISAGEHTLTIYYLERGSSQSNCAIYFNLAPRYSFQIQKEDILTREVLNGAQFSVFTDRACTVPAELWTGKDSHDAGDPATNVFTVENGTASMWGMSAGNTYYIKETRSPTDENYEGLPDGLIHLTFDKTGLASYNVEVIDTGSGISGGFTVHGFRIDEETQQAYIVATNAPKWVRETTSVQVRKRWQDQLSHNGQTITVYLTVTAQDGTVRRIQEAQLGTSNNWNYQWENLPKYWEDGTPIRYGVEEAYISGYYNKVELVDSYSETTSSWQKTGSLQPGKVYILGTSNGYLSTSQQAADTGFKWVDAATAKNSSLARWTVTASGSTYRLTNEAGQILTLYYGNGSPTDFFAYTTQQEDSNYKQYLSYSASGESIRLYFDRPNSSTNYYLSSMMSNGKFQYNTNSGNAIVFTPETLVETTTNQQVTGDWPYLITNSPLDQETSLTVQKYWDYGYLQPGTLHEQAQVTVKLLANGRDTGRTVTLSLKNGWSDTFRGLPYVDSGGNVISYSVEESWDTPDWVPVYGNVSVHDGATPSYSTTVTNKYRWGIGGPMLPSTGTAARMMYILCGGSIMLTSLVYGIILRRKRERRMKQAF